MHHSRPLFRKNCLFPASFLQKGPFQANFFVYFCLTVNMIIVKFCQSLNSNSRPLLTEASDRSTEWAHNQCDQKKIAECV